MSTTTINTDKEAVNEKPKPTTYKEAFTILKKNAEILRKDEGEDIDILVSIMKESKEAYDVCMERIESVKKSIPQYSSDSSVASPTLKKPIPEPTPLVKK